MCESQPDKFLNVSETRNSIIRQLSSGTVKNITTKIHEVIPSLHPDHLNILGAAGVSTGSLIAASRERRPGKINNILTGLSLGAIGIGSVTDAFDGSLARILAKEGRKIDFSSGQVKDAVSDRVQELSMSLSRAITAHKRGDKYGEYIALLTASTNTLPSLVRSISETKGIAVPETGKNWQGLVGTRIGRAAIGTIATTYPEIKGIPVQKIADTLTVGANILTTWDRLNYVIKDNEIASRLREKTVEEAKMRKTALGICAVVAGVSSIITYKFLDSK